MTRIAVKRPVTTVMVILIFIAVGIMSLTNLEMALLPKMDLPYAAVFTTYTGASPEQVESLVSKKMEGALAQLNGLSGMTSMSGDGSSVVILEFDQGVDIDMAAIDIREAIDRVKYSLPDDAGDPMVYKMDTTSMASMYIAVSSQTDDLVSLKNKVDDELLDRLVRQNGVADIAVYGGREKEIRVDLLEDRIRGYGITESQVAALLASENASQPMGSIDEGGKSLSIKVDGEFTDIEEIKNLPVTNSRGGIVFIRDIAEVTEIYKDIDTYAFLNGSPAVVLEVSKQSSANDVNVSNALKGELSKIYAEYPELDIKIIMDSADYITDSINSVVDTAISGVILAVIVLFIFLRNVKATLVVGSAIPVSIVVTFAFMYFYGMTLNMMSLGGLVLGVGMLVDNSIVVLESVFRRMEEGESKTRAAINGANEVAMSIVASTLTTLAVFLPVAWMSGMISQIFNDLSLSIGFALTASLLVALTFVPLACSLFLTPNPPEAPETYLARHMRSLAEHGPPRIRGIWEAYKRVVKKCVTPPREGRFLAWQWIKYPFRLIGLVLYHLLLPFMLLYVLLQLIFALLFKPISIGLGFVEKYILIGFRALMDLISRGIDGMSDGYRTVMKWATYHRGLVILLAILMFAGSISSVLFVGMELIPSGDQSQINITVTPPTGAVLERTKSITDQVVERLDGVEEILDVTTQIGSGTGQVMVSLVPMKERSRDSTEVADAIRKRMRDIAGAEIDVEASTSMMGGGMSMGSGGGDVSFTIKGDGIDDLIVVANDLIKILEGVDGLRDVTSSVSDTTPQATIKVDRMKASSFGLTASSVMSTVRTTITGTAATTFKVSGTELDVRVSQDDSKVQNLQDLENLLIPTASGISVPLREVATITITNTPLSITREDQQTMVSVSGYLELGRDLGTVSRAARGAIDSQYIFPQGVTLAVSGSSQQMDEEFNNLILAFIMGIFIVYAVMAAEFESTYYPMIILFAVPVALSTGILGLLIMGQKLGITAALGLIMLLGIVVNNGIVLVDYINLLRGKGMDMMEAVQEAGPVRLRAILMTTLTTTLGLVPMMLGTAEGSEMMQPLATVVVWGLTFSTLVTLFFVPVIYICFENIRNRLSRGKVKKFRQIEEV